MGAVRHRHDDARPAARPLTLEEGGEDPRDRRQRSAGEVGDLGGRQRGSRVRKHTCPAEIVEVVAGAVHVAAAAAEASQRAEDHRFREVVRPDAETLDDARPEALEDDVGVGAERATLLGLGLQVD